MSDEGSSNSVGIVAILAALVLVGIAAFFVWGRSGSSHAPATTSTTSQPADSDIKVKIDLPDSVTIK